MKIFSMESKLLINSKQLIYCLLKMQPKLTRQLSLFKIKLPSIVIQLKRRKPLFARKQLENSISDMLLVIIVSKAPINKRMSKQRRSIQKRRSTIHEKKRRS